jgi:hypothetical protein
MKNVYRGFAKRSWATRRRGAQLGLYSASGYRRSDTPEARERFAAIDAERARRRALLAEKYYAKLAREYGRSGAPLAPLAP